MKRTVVKVIEDADGYAPQFSIDGGESFYKTGRRYGSAEEAAEAASAPICSLAGIKGAAIALVAGVFVCLISSISAILIGKMSLGFSPEELAVPLFLVFLICAASSFLAYAHQYRTAKGRIDVRFEGAAA